MTDTERFRIQWLLGYLKGAMAGVWAMCDAQEHEVVTPEAVGEMERYVDELTELVGRETTNEWTVCTNSGTAPRARSTTTSATGAEKVDE